VGLPKNGVNTTTVYELDALLIFKCRVSPGGSKLFIFRAVVFDHPLFV
jgi:hypothetical protein